MRPKQCLLQAVLLFIMLLSGRASWGQSDAPLIQVLSGATGNFKVDSFVTVEDSKWWTPAEKAKIDQSLPMKLQNIVTLKLNETSTTLIRSNFTTEVEVRLIYTNKDGLADSTSYTFLVDYDTTHGGAMYNSQRLFTINNAYRLTSRIVSINTSFPAGTTSWDVTPLLRLENEMQISRYYNFSCSSMPPSFYSYIPGSDLGSLFVFYGKIAGATEYDFEYTFIDSLALTDTSLYGSFSSPTPARIFDAGSTRVTTTAESFSIPLLFQNSGYIFSRVRGVQVRADGQRIEGKWSTQNTPSPIMNRFYFAGHQRNLNWQSTTSFAEESKRKSVVQYYDGSLRARQTVTRDNSIQSIIVAESIYDYQGRPAIQILPAPKLSNLIGYVYDFNKALDGGNYDKSLFDSLSAGADCCDTPAPAMSGTSGANYYYSSSWGYSNVLNSHKALPKAFGFAFAQTKYSRDNTGRVLAQGGVGEQHQIGSGHETRYFYGKPDQLELDALFGTEAGDASHYQKNMVRDANGQYSVSYVDMHGRTVATALAGKPATVKLDTLESYTSQVITKNLIEPSSTVISGLTMESSTGLVVTKAGTHQFQYSLQPDSLRLLACDSSQVCYDCVYNLEISINDECNNQDLPGDTRFILLDSNFTLGAMDTSCGNVIPSIDTVFSLMLLEGSYNIVKKLSVSRPGYEYYRDSVFLKKNLCRTFDSFYQAELAIQQSQACDPPSCATCLVNLGTYAQYRSKYITDNAIDSSQLTEMEDQIKESYTTAKMDCDILCDSLSLQDGTRDMMLADMMPESGQYADPEKFAYPKNIFYQSSLGAPYNYQSISPQYYVDENGKRDSIYNDNGKLVPPSDLSITKERFIAQFKASWAKALLPTHPEYNKLLIYESFRVSNLWDQAFEKVNTYAEAKAKGYLNPVELTGYGYLPAVTGGTDPLLTINSTLYNKLKQLAINYRRHGILSNWYSMWGMATATAHCNDGDQTCFTNYLALNKAFDSTALCQGELDMAWRSFQQIYLTEKRKIIDDYIKSFPSSGNAIPTEYFQHFPDTDDVMNGLEYGTTPEDILADAGNSMTALQSSNCEAYVQQWWSKLATCNFSTADSLIIIPRLIGVCKEGSDVSHPYGSSTVKPGSGYFYKSFDDVIKTYLDSLSRTYDENCNGFLIRSPQPYERPAAYASMPIWSKPDSCQCSQITRQQQQFLASGSADVSFAAYLKRTANVDMSESDLQRLLSMCKGEQSCKYLVQPIKLPPVLQCAPAPACLECDSINAFHNRFVTRFGVSPSYDDNDSLQIRRNLLYGNYMNFFTGFNKDYASYLQFRDTCSAYSAGTGTCDTLKTILKNFRTGYYLNPATTPGYNADGCDTTSNIISQNKARDSSYVKYAHLFKDGILHVPDSVYTHLWRNTWEDSMRLKQFGTSFTKACNLENGFTWEVRVKAKEFASPIPQTGMYGTADGILMLVNTPEINAGAGAYIYIYFDYDGAIYMEPGFPTEQSTPNLKEKFPDWKTITIKAEDNKIKVFINGVLRHERTYTGTITYLNQLGLAFAQCDGFLDYQRLYDKDGRVILAEEYDNACASFDVINPRYDCFKLPCDQAFTNYFNTQRGTSYTLAQIQSQYLLHCGREAKPCQLYDDAPKLCSDGDLFPEIELPDQGPCSDSSILAYTIATEKFKAYKDSLLAAFDQQYLGKCMNAYKYEHFTVNAPVSEFHYTLYYYDQAGNLLKTIAPSGVDGTKFGWASNWSDSVKIARAAGAFLVPQHRMPTEYRYNTLNQVVAQKSPDGGASKFWYDRLGRLVLSQNAKQQLAENGDFSYTKYDVLGRITEVGEINNASAQAISDGFTRNATTFAAWITSNASHRRQITNTYYDVPYAGFSGLSEPLVARNLRNRVSYSTITKGNNPTTYDQASFYSYDIHGNVDTLLQDYRTGAMALASQRFKKLVYRYDLISGKVNAVAYQPGKVDQFYHRYSYDAENRLTIAETSSDSLVWERDASYQYYWHGPLARTLLGQQKVQGVDYGYTLQGWLKVINGVGPAYNDIAMDGYVNNLGVAYGFDTKVGRDAYGINLNYFGGDYVPTIGMAIAPNPAPYLDTLFHSLYNGNIAGMSVSIPSLPYTINTYGGAVFPTLFYNYYYDQLNRLKRMDKYVGFNMTGQAWDLIKLNKNADYEERVKYDPNGNILKYLRNGTAQNGNKLSMDSLEYRYYAGTNQLRQVRDTVPNDNYKDANADIDDQPDADNYIYDAIGNLIQDKQEQIDHIAWTVYGKIDTIQKQDGTTIVYSYDASGNRVSKKVSKGEELTTTWYVRDATGNVMSTYRLKGDSTIQEEIHLYGSSRLGMMRPDRLLSLERQYGDTSGTISLLGTWRGKTFRRGMKIFELSNHLGNVLVTVSDKKLQVTTNGTSISFYSPDVLTANDYYPGGMEMPGRTYTIGNGYRYSINGQEKTPEIAPNTTTAEFWQYDARIVRRWNVDPRPQTYSSPYAVFDNSPIWRSDPLGDTSKPAPVPYMNTVSSDGDWLKGAMLLPGNTYAKAYNTFAGTTNTIVEVAQKSSKDGLGPGLMGWIDGIGEDLKDWWNGTKEYHTKTPFSQQLTDARNWISNPDNVYGTISDGIILYSTYRFQAGIQKNWSDYSMKGNVPEWGSGGVVKKLVYPDITSSEVINTIGNRFAGLRDRKTKFEVKVFGSAVRGAPNPNDLDVLIITTDKAIFYESTRAAKIINTIKNDFFEKSGKPLDVNIMSPEEYMRAKGGAFKTDVENVAKNF